MNKRKQVDVFEIFLYIYILVYPIIRYYYLPGGSNLYILILNIIVIGRLFVDKVRVRVPIWFLIFFAWILISTCFSYVSSYSSRISITSINNFIIFLDVLIMFLLITNIHFDFDKFIGIYRVICTILILFFFFQFLGDKIGIAIPDGRIPFLPIDDIYLNRYYSFGIYRMGSYTRYSSLFIEPSHLSQYLIPFLCLQLIGYKDVIKKNIVLALITSLVLVLCLSGTGIALTASVWIMYFIINTKKITARKLIFGIVTLIVVVAGIIIALRLPGVQSMISGMFDTNSDGSKSSYRLIRGFLIFIQLPLWNKLVGVGFQCFDVAISYFNLNDVLLTGSAHVNYMNDIASLLLSFGLIGISFLMFFVIKLLRNSNKEEIMIFIVFLLIFFSESTLGVKWLFYMTIGLAVFRKKNSEQLYD